MLIFFIIVGLVLMIGSAIIADELEYCRHENLHKMLFCLSILGTMMCIVGMCIWTGVTIAGVIS